MLWVLLCLALALKRTQTEGLHKCALRYLLVIRLRFDSGTGSEAESSMISTTETADKPP